MTDYSFLLQQAKSLSDGEKYRITVLSNLASLIYNTLDNINWAGFYLLKDRDLYLGPFCGKPACTRIPAGKGVCGTSVQDRCILVVPDVHSFPGHIACDCASRSEIVLPIFQGNGIVGVLDIDSPVPGRFSDSDKAGLEDITAYLGKRWEELEVL